MFEPMSQEPSVRMSGSCPDCGDAVFSVVCEAGHTDCFTVECVTTPGCGFWESNCYGGADNE